jgi:hypothetical protein
MGRRIRKEAIGCEHTFALVYESVAHWEYLNGGRIIIRRERCTKCRTNQFHVTRAHAARI